MGGNCLMKMGFPFEVLELGSANNCATLLTYLVPVNCTL